MQKKKEAAWLLFFFVPQRRKAPDLVFRFFLLAPIRPSVFLLSLPVFFHSLFSRLSSPAPTSPLRSLGPATEPTKSLSRLSHVSAPFLSSFPPLEAKRGSGRANRIRHGVDPTRHPGGGGRIPAPIRRSLILCGRFAGSFARAARASSFVPPRLRRPLASRRLDEPSARAWPRRRVGIGSTGQIRRQMVGENPFGIKKRGRP